MCRQSDGKQVYQTQKEKRMLATEKSRLCNQPGNTPRYYSYFFFAVKLFPLTVLRTWIYDFCNGIIEKVKVF